MRSSSSSACIFSFVRKRMYRPEHSATKQVQEGLGDRPGAARDHEGNRAQRAVFGKVSRQLHLWEVQSTAQAFRIRLSSVYLFEPRWASKRFLRSLLTISCHVFDTTWRFEFGQAGMLLLQVHPWVSIGGFFVIFCFFVQYWTWWSCVRSYCGDKKATYPESNAIKVLQVRIAVTAFDADWR